MMLLLKDNLMAVTYCQDFWNKQSFCEGRGEGRFKTFLGAVVTSGDSKFLLRESEDYPLGAVPDEFLVVSILNLYRDFMNVSVMYKPVGEMSQGRILGITFTIRQKV